MLELRYAILDENGFVIELEDQQCENSIGIYTETNSEFALGYRKYRFDTEKNEFIYDESNVIEECKESLKLEIEYELRKNKNKKFNVILDSGDYTFDYSNDLKNKLTSNQVLYELGLDDSFKIPCKNKNGEKINISTNKNDLKKILKSMVNHVNKKEELIEEYKNTIDGLTSIKEISEFKKNHS